MATYLIVIALVLSLASAGFLARRLAASDGGPRHDPMPTRDQAWHPFLPSHPYSTDH